MKSYKNDIDENACHTITYSEAASFFKEKRELLERLNEINSGLRRLQQQNPDAVAEARMDVPFRDLLGRKKQDCTV